MKGGWDAGGCFPTGLHYPGIASLMKLRVAGLAEGVDPLAAVRELPLVCIDTETTGRDPREDRVVELACVFCDGGQLGERRSWLINPGRPIPAAAQAVHGIGDADVADKPSFAEIAEEVREALSGRVPVAYNAAFDRDFLREEFARLGSVSDEAAIPALAQGLVWLDPLTWARHLQRTERSRALGDVCQRLGIEIGQAHRATDDAAATLQVLLVFLADERVPRAYGAFVQEQRRHDQAFADQRRFFNR